MDSRCVMRLQVGACTASEGSTCMQQRQTPCCVPCCLNMQTLACLLVDPLLVLTAVKPKVRMALQDSAGNAAVPGIRRVFVACKAPTVMCSASDDTAYCSTGNGLCLPVLGPQAWIPPPSYPTIKLVGQAVLGLMQGTSYLACPDPQPTNVICDR